MDKQQIELLEHVKPEQIKLNSIEVLDVAFGNVEVVIEKLSIYPDSLKDVIFDNYKRILKIELKLIEETDFNKYWKQ